MGGKFNDFAVVTSQDVFYNIYNHFANSGQNVIEFASQGGSTALWNNVAYVASFANAAACVAGSFMVIQPATANGGVKWQYKIVLVSTTGAITGQPAPSGGWTAASQFGAAVVGTATNINDGSSPAASSAVYVGCNTQSYNGGANTFTYAYVMIKDGAAADQFSYIGGYVPASPAADTKPVCWLLRSPDLTAGASGVSRGDTTGNNLNRMATEYAHTTTWTSSGFACIRASDSSQSAPGFTLVNRDYAGNYLSQYLYLYSISPAGQHGDFAAILTTAQTGIASYQVNAAATYIKFGDLWVYYNKAL